jgi:hypothetical protein
MTCLGLFFIAAAFLGFVAQPATAQLTMQFPVERDAGIDGWDNHTGYGGVYDPSLETEEFTNHGGIAARVRGKKGTQHTAIMDWDTAAINQWLAANTRPGDIRSWTFNLYPVDAPVDDLQLLTLESLNDWVEGDGATDYENFNWSEGTGAVTQNFAVTYWTFDGGQKVLDEAKSVPWVDDDSGTGGINDNEYSVLARGDNLRQGNPIPNFQNSADLSVLDLEDAAFNSSFASVALDDVFINAILNDPNNRGIVFGPIDSVSGGSVNSSTNWRFWSREATGNEGELAADYPGPFAAFLEVTVTPGAAGPLLQPGDSDQDLDFDQFDVIRVQQAAKYLTGQAATWGEGDWDGAPGGSQGSPPAGNGRFDQLDIVSALAAGKYLTGKYGALAGANGVRGDGQTTIVYNAGTGEVAVDAPGATQLTSINIDSAGRIFTGAPAQNLGGSFDNDADNNIFKATFGSSFGSLSFGNVAQAGLSQQFVLNDLTVVGSLAGGGALGNVDLIYIPEPSAIVLFGLGVVALLGYVRRRRR